ncbi:hypothetical protein BO94DRAFT_594530 [Aspergillus sclerotioniger CBS 115572]|uniref:DUF7600 domain-containing protein n=1 Tax=Aspergillus sclerotioniger CBS 115572 TaxID=1450535 RepID=A0A317WUB5_9EURO|nr:hypothetical protein BO94DRAFT_594530 [Aspergillus sclerotioniger CBS 115572]PWY89675.1 hypothetical protein BO94DRAFT_594530 [Aspergillus sclerotioniger CBS 115572]
MDTNVYCPFCGIILEFDPDYDFGFIDDDGLPTARPWYAEVRGLYAADPPTGSIRITGVGIVRAEGNLNAPVDSDLSYVDVGLDALEEWAFCKTTEPRWCFGFHNSCWKLLLRRLSHGRGGSSPDETTIVESVFYQLYCTPCFDGSCFQLGHDYLGAAQAQTLHGNPLQDILNLRLVCRDLATHANGLMISQSYWRHRFLPGQEADFILPRSSDIENWFGLFFGTRELITIGCRNLVNRKRIIRLLEPFANLVNRESALRNGPSGLAFEIAQRSGSRILLIDSEDGGQQGQLGSRLVGYHNPASEKRIEIPSPSHAEAISLMFSSDGLTGIGFIFTPFGPTIWIGEHYGPMIAQTTIGIPDGDDPCYLLAGLDHFKIVSLGIGKPFDPILDEVLVELYGTRRRSQQKALDQQFGLDYPNDAQV